MKDFWSGRSGLARHFWLYFILPIAALTGAVDALAVLGQGSPVVTATLYTAAALVALVTALPLFLSIVRSNKGVVWKLLVAAVALLTMWSVMRLAYYAIQSVP